ncbi:copper homeostasis protein CutC [Salinimicrobium sp. GXAS 041]|uniref:copper homeostasis protein CutC n=1 Tax=Salinimicrobium sp. GXAS 041 TaxID=3400806 RepID=UPI003C75A4BE
MMSSYKKEACVGNLLQVKQAKIRGADRVELCDRLDLDGITPSRDFIVAAVKTGLPVRVMIRPRAGDFIYSEAEFDEMIDSIKLCKELGVEGVVFGILDKEHNLNFKQIERLAEIASPLKVVVHKAIDETPNPVDAVRNLLKIEAVSAVLTSGGKSTALEGEEILKKMLKVAGRKFEIVAAGKITDKNIHEVHHLVGAGTYHGKKIVGDLNSNAKESAPTKNIYGG